MAHGVACHGRLPSLVRVAPTTPGLLCGIPTTFARLRGQRLRCQASSDSSLKTLSSLQPEDSSSALTQQNSTLTSATPLSLRRDLQQRDLWQVTTQAPSSLHPRLRPLGNGHWGPGKKGAWSAWRATPTHPPSIQHSTGKADATWQSLLSLAANLGKLE